MDASSGHTTGDDTIRGERSPRLESADEPGPGGRLGGERSYRLVEELGRGGMGRVFLAERSDGEFRHRVAIKLLAWNVGGNDDAARRFRTERQILARLNHPNIARLLDGGTTPQGQPFLVMEYIEGEAIDDFAAARELTVAQRVELFLKVCEAVRTAHQSLVVHRDLKPANILVDRQGEPKLLDFGIAKLLDPELVGDAAVTRFGEALLTPRYASPEQVTGATITTASDIYSLGVVLYELLAGEAPYELTLAAPLELVRAICDTVPAPPSVAAAVSAADNGAPSGARIPRDLDEIVLKALRKGPGERYGSVDAFADDLRRFLDGRPVEARRGGRTYRIARFARRHRWALAGAAIFLVTVAVFIAGLTRQLDETARQRDEAARQRDTARAVTDFLVKIFGASDPAEARGTEITAREVLDRGAERIDTELTGQPVVRATLLHELGVVYQNLGAFERSSELLESALAEREKLLPEATRDVVESRYRLGWSQAQGGVHAKGEATLRAALAEIQSAGWSDPALEVVIRNGLGSVLIYQEKYADAEAILLGSLAYRDLPEVSGKAPLMGTLNNLGMLHYYRQRWEEAIPYFRDALDLELALRGKDHPDEVTLRSNLAWSLSGDRQFDEAEVEARRAWEIGGKVLGPDHVVTQYSGYRLAWALQHLGRLDEAIPIHRQVAESRKRTRLDSPFFEVTSSLQMLARAHAWKGDYPAAIATYREAIAVARRLMPDPLDSEILRAEAELGWFLALAGRQHEAEELLDRVVSGLRGKESSFAYQEVRVAQGAALARNPARREEAKAQLLSALESLPADGAEARVARRFALVALARIAEQSRGRDEAVARYREALALEDELAPGDPERGEVARALAALGEG